VDENGAEFPISDVFLADFSESNGVSATVPASKYTKLRFSVGVPAEINTNTDPATYPSSSPLSVSGSEGMFWTWNSGYIFVKFEGKTAFTPDASNLTEPYAFHVGSDAFYTTHEYAIDFEIGEEDETLNILFDANKFLNGTDDVINLQQDNLTHTMDNMMLANRFVALFNESISVRK
jgi:hypothetical protein